MATLHVIADCREVAELREVTGSSAPRLEPHSGFDISSSLSRCVDGWLGLLRAGKGTHSWLLYVFYSMFLRLECIGSAAVTRELPVLHCILLSHTTVSHYNKARNRRNPVIQSIFNMTFTTQSYGTCQCESWQPESEYAENTSPT